MLEFWFYKFLQAVSAHDVGADGSRCGVIGTIDTHDTDEALARKLQEDEQREHDLASVVSGSTASSHNSLETDDEALARRLQAEEEAVDDDSSSPHLLETDEALARLLQEEERELSLEGSARGDAVQGGSDRHSMRSQRKLRILIKTHTHLSLTRSHAHTITTTDVG